MVFLPFESSSCCDCLAHNLFSKLSPELSRFLDIKKSRHTYRKKQILFYEDHPAEGIYCLRTGRVKVYKTGPEGKQYILKLAGPNDILGLESMFTQEHFLATAEVIEEGEICFFDKKSVLKILEEDPKISIKIIEELATQLKTSEEERVELAQMAVRDRMARLLTSLSKSHGVPVKKGIKIDLKLSREEMAEMIGTAAETAMRLLKSFKEEKLVEVHGREIVILDKGRLEKNAHLSE